MQAMPDHERGCRSLLLRKRKELRSQVAHAASPLKAIKFCTKNCRGLRTATAGLRKARRVLPLVRSADGPARSRLGFGRSKTFDMIRAS